MSDIFDLEKIDDLPADIIKDLKIRQYNIITFEGKIRELFVRAQRPLKIDEVVVAYFRLYKEYYGRKNMMAKLYNISRSKDPYLESIKGKKGVYKLK